MDKAILYFSDKCSDTVAFVEELATQGIPYEEVNITDNMTNLKRFLSLRDTRPEFEDTRNWGFVGIPALHLPNNSIILEIRDLQGTSCNLTPR